MVAPASLLLLGAGGVAFVAYVAKRREDESRAASLMARIDSSAFRFAPPQRRLLQPETTATASSDLRRWAPSSTAILSVPFSPKVMSAYADEISARLPFTRSGVMTWELVQKARARGIRTGDWGPLAGAIRVAAEVGAAQGLKGTTPQDQNRAVDLAKHILLDPVWTAHMTDEEVRERMARVMSAIYAGTAMPSLDPSRPAATASCDLEVPAMGVPYHKVWGRRGDVDDGPRECRSRMRRLDQYWSNFMRQGGPMGATDKQLRYAFADMARQRAGAWFSNASAQASALPGTLREFIVGIGVIAGGPAGGVFADLMLNEASS